MRQLAIFFAAVNLAFAAQFSVAQDKTADPNAVATPAIQGYGGIHYLPKSAYLPEANQHYKIVFAMSMGSKSASELNPALERVARAVNLYVAAGVPLSHLKFVAVAYGAATPLILNNAQYMAKFGVANPNLPLIAELRKAGVDVAVCGQAVGEHHFDYSWIDPSVTLSLSAMTTVSTLEQQGYSPVQL